MSRRTEWQGTFNPKEPAGRRHLIITASTLVVFVLVGVAAILLWDYSNSMSFCASTCHTMPPEADAQARSAHARVTCVECHIGRVSTPRAIQLKLTHGRHLTNLIFNSFERPIFIKTLRPTRVTCEECHWPEQFHEDRVVELRHFLPDAVNTEKDTYLIMYTGGGVSAQGQGRGIHWHIENKIYYIADTKDLRQAIPWVQVVAPDGTTTEYVDVASKLSGTDIQKATKYLMDCNDCHSRTAHLFLPPDREIDAEMAAGRIDPGIPSIKAQLSRVLNATYNTTAEGEQAIRALSGYYQSTYADYYGKNKQKVDAAIEDAVRVFNVTYFPNLSTGWQSHPDNVGHKDFPGCFRCHDGQHLSNSGDSIRLECNVCHSIPISYRADSPPKAAELGSLLQRAVEPENHKNSNYIRDHRFLADASCEPCHGPVTVGTDDKTFCGNSNCHGTQVAVGESRCGVPAPRQAGRQARGPVLHRVPPGSRQAGLRVRLVPQAAGGSLLRRLRELPQHQRVQGERIGTDPVGAAGHAHAAGPRRLPRLPCPERAAHGAGQPQGPDQRWLPEVPQGRIAQPWPKTDPIEELPRSRELFFVGVRPNPIVPKSSRPTPTARRGLASRTRRAFHAPT